MDDRKPPPAGGSRPPPASDSAKPTPVRVTMGGREPGEPDLRFEGRSVHLGDEEWWAQELGWTTSGRHEDPGALLLLVGFRPRSDPEDSYQREALLAADDLSDVPDEVLEAALREATPFREIPDEPKPFFGPRGKQRRGGRPGSRGRGRRGR